MLAGFARQFNPLSLSKAGYHAGLTSLLLLMGAGSVHDATALNETRTLSFHHTHSDEDITVTFKRDGRYDEEALKQLNHYLRDWRSQEESTMDRHLFDILWEVYRDVDGKKPIQIISSYRSPATNAMLRRRSSGVARFSQHMLGHAMDFFIPDVPLEQIRYAGLRLQRGGVGFYPTSGSPFVHLDTPAPTSKTAVTATTPRQRANLACSPHCSEASRTTRMTRVPAPRLSAKKLLQSA